MDPVFVWVLTAVLALAGAAGVLLPVLPGTPLIFAAAAVNKALLPDALSWWTVGGLGFLCLVAEGGELLLTLGGARRFGATRWGMGGAALGALLGLFGGLTGILLGAAAGALVGEAVFAGRSLGQAGRAAVGATLGVVASLAGRIVVTLTMLAWLLADSLF